MENVINLNEIFETRIIFDDTFVQKEKKPKSISYPSISSQLKYKFDHHVKISMNEVIFKVKKMSTVQLKKIFKKVRNHECSEFYDRQMLIFVISEMMIDPKIYSMFIHSTQNLIIERNRIFVQWLISITNELDEDRMNLVQRIKTIRTLYESGEYGYNKIGKMFNLSHVFVRNIIIGKVYKNI